MQRIEQVVGFGGDHGTWHCKNRCTLLSGPLRSNCPQLFADGDVPPIAVPRAGGCFTWQRLGSQREILQPLALAVGNANEMGSE